ESRSVIDVSSTPGLHGNVGQFGVRANTVAFDLVHTRLTAAKEVGATIEIDGKTLALGISGPRGLYLPRDISSFPFAAEGRRMKPLPPCCCKYSYVLFPMGLLVFAAWHRHSHLIFQDTRWKSLEMLVSKISEKKRLYQGFSPFS
ncbi:hypothetical protein EDD18DRAFT_1059067, partial [Armillaria luteobubalina]